MGSFWQRDSEGQWKLSQCENAALNSTTPVKNTSISSPYSSVGSTSFYTPYYKSPNNSKVDSGYRSTYAAYNYRESPVNTNGPYNVNNTSRVHENASYPSTKLFKTPSKPLSRQDIYRPEPPKSTDMPKESKAVLK
jgi:hypothetical protein